MSTIPTPQNLLRIDGHAHVFLKSLTVIENRRYTPNYSALAQDYFNHLKSHNLNGGLLIQPSFLGTDNSHLLSVIAEASLNEPDLVIRGVAVLDPLTSMNEMQLLKGSGITGIRLNCLSQPLPNFENKVWKQYLKRVDAMGWHVEVQVEGHRLNSIVDSLLKTNTRIIVDHFGLPSSVDPNQFTNLNTILKDSSPNVCVKVSAPYRVYRHLPLQQAVDKCGELASQLLESIGDQRLIWGSDWPWTQHENSQSYNDCFNWGKQWLGENSNKLGNVPLWLMYPDNKNN